MVHWWVGVSLIISILCLPRDFGLLNCVSVTSWQHSYLIWGAPVTQATMCVISRTVKDDGSFTMTIKLPSASLRPKSWDTCTYIKDVDCMKSKIMICVNTNNFLLI